MTSKSKRTWLSVLVAALIVTAMLGAAAIGSIVFFVVRHVDTEEVAAGAAEERLARARERFAGQRPLIEIGDDREAVVRRAELDQPTVGSARLQRLHALAYEPDDRRLVDVNIPFWMLRLAPDGRISLLSGSGVRFQTDHMRVTVADLERRGPGLVLDHRDRSGAQILVWTE